MNHIYILTVLILGIGVAIILALVENLTSQCKILKDWVRVAGQTRSNENPLGTMVAPEAGEKPTRQFRVVLAKGLLPLIHRYVSDFLKVNGSDQEAGGMLVGNYVFDAATGDATFQIQGFIDAGPAVQFSAGSVLFDAEHQAHALRALQLEHPVAANLGCIHRHPGSMDVCSGGDAVTDRQAVKDSDTKALVFAIITLNNLRQGPSSLFHEDFKIDFYLMAEETGFKYVPIMPSLADLPVLEVSPAMSALLTLRDPDVVYDLAVLRQLPDLGKTLLHYIDSGSSSGLWVNVSFKSALETIHIWIQPDGRIRIMVKDVQGAKKMLRGPWEQPELGRHVWLSQLVLQTCRQLREVRPVPAYGSHYAGLLSDKHRLVAEVRAMRERYGDRAILRQDGGGLYWAYTVRESGRSFPIKIHYPSTYPNDPPKIISVQSLPPSPHQFGVNELCWINHFTAHSEWNPSRDTAVICINAAHRWFACLLIYLTKGKWPEGADH